jgi:hypothetical protein
MLVRCWLDDHAARRGGCSVRDLYDCTEERACVTECQEESADPCAQQRQVMLGICSESPPPPVP